MYIAWQKCIHLVLLYVVLCSIFYYFRSLYSLCISSRSHWYTCSHRTSLPHHVLASCMLVDLNIWCVYVESLLNICRLTSVPTFPAFPIFPYFLIQSPTFPYFLTKQAILSLLFGVSCCQLK